jgi:hypothetical protein
MELIANLDSLNGTSMATIADAMSNRIADSVGVDLSDSPQLIVDQDLEGLLAAWQVDELDCELILDCRSPLLFFALQSALGESERLAPIASEEVRRYIASMTALFVQHTCFTVPEFHT